jgi:hypothetical protein
VVGLGDEFADPRRKLDDAVCSLRLRGEHPDIDGEDDGRGALVRYEGRGLAIDLVWRGWLSAVRPGLGINGVQHRKAILRHAADDAHRTQQTCRIVDEVEKAGERQRAKNAGKPDDEGGRRRVDPGDGADREEQLADEQPTVKRITLSRSSVVAMMRGVS